MIAHDSPPSKLPNREDMISNDSPSVPPPPNSMSPSVDFSNTELAFKALSTPDLKRRYRMYRLIDSPVLTKIGPTILTSAFQWGLPVRGLVRDTIFEIFCGGESLVDTVDNMKALDQFGVKTILDYSVEGEKNEMGYEETFQELLRTLVHGGEHPEIVFVACKMTGLASTSMMEAVQAGGSLSASQEAEKVRALERLDQLCAAAVKYTTPLLIDAEESWIQDFIDDAAEAMMARYNKEIPWIYTTAQLYRHDRLAYLGDLIRRSREGGFKLGVKVVRGAYLEKENERAKEMGYATPMQPTKAATDRDFDAALALCMEHIDQVSICAGTHNEQSSLYLTQLMAQKNLSPDDSRVWFAQLLGMSDHISYNLAHAGYLVAKYLPYGPVEAVMPYLMRRAQENTAIAGQSSREVQLLRQEVERRSRRG